MCLFCEIIEGNIPSKKVYEDDQVLAILDISQATRGHTLVMPKQHFRNIYDIDPQTLAHLIEVVRKLAIQITEKTGAAGCNILSNNNEAAGQSVMHLHFHIIPRYPEDDWQFPTPSHDYDLDEILHQITD
ncbi:MAG: HIT family protein [Erysipelotrichaceae bacterium]|nr:HIT family protein [Erysipelotrichaceae bacterium]MBO4537667.1 HIT family protein [Erysipelotrichaceae bacterium]MBR5049541.1 HIT family protein [Erysipelotrichaceae bacterium]